MSPSPDPTESRQPATSSNGYPLAALFVLVAICAILLGLLTPVFRQSMSGGLDWELLAGVTFGAAIGGAMIGGIAGLFVRPWYVASPISAGVGCGAGLMCGPLFLTNSQSLPAVLLATVGGAVVIVGVALVVRLSGRETE